MSNKDERRIAYYRQMAAIVAARVEEAPTPELKRTYIDLASSWIALAEAVERFSQPPGQPASDSDQHPTP